MSPLSAEAIEAGLVAAGVPRDRARAQALRECGLSLVPNEADQAKADEREEKRIVADADKRMRALGFVVWNLSQPRASKIAPGIPDRLYTSPARGLAVFWEAKTVRGKQRPDQAHFQAHADACGLHYVIGTDLVLAVWLADRGITLTDASPAP